MSDKSIFDTEAPPHFEFFESNWQMSQRNADSMMNISGDVRKVLSNKQASNYKRKLKKIESDLDEAGVIDILQIYDELRAEYNDLRRQHYSIEKSIEDGADERKARSEMAIIVANAKSLREDIEAAHQKLKPYRNNIILKRRIQQRLDEHEAALIDAKIEADNTRRMELEANSVAEIIIRAANAQDFCFKTSRNGKERVISIVFKRVIVTPDTIQLQIEAAERGLFGGFIWKVPQGVNIPGMLRDENFLSQLSGAIGMPVSSPQVGSGRWWEGYWIFVQRNGLTDGVKEHVRYSDYMSRYPNDLRESIPFPTGLREGGWVSWGELANQPHAIVTGQTGSGKTNAMLSIICTLISNHSPDEVQFVIGDLKEGVDLGMFASAPQVIAVIEDVPTLAKAVAKMEHIRAERMIELKRAGLRNINVFNRFHPEYRMPHLIFVMDEFGAIAARRYASEAQTIYDACAQIAMKGRAAGIHLIIGAQTPRKEHIPADVRDNITIRFSGRQQSLYASISSTGSGAASRLAKIPGRFWLEDGADGYQVQMPEIKDDEVVQAIKASQEFERIELIDLIDGRDTPTPTTIEIATSFGVNQFLDYVIDHLDGSINYRAVYDAHKDRLTLSQSKMLAEQIKRQERVEYRGQVYELASVRRGMRLTRIKNQDVSNKPQNGLNQPVNLNLN